MQEVLENELKMVKITRTKIEQTETLKIYV